MPVIDYKDFFRINMPYGMRKNENNEWFFFNREKMPLGWNKENNTNYDPPTQAIFTKYSLLTDPTLLKLSCDGENAIKRNDKGEIEIVFLYNDKKNPQSHPEYWNEYFEKIKLLSKCEMIR